MNSTTHSTGSAQPLNNYLGNSITSICFLSPFLSAIHVKTGAMSLICFWFVCSYGYSVDPAGVGFVGDAGAFSGKKGTHTFLCI